MFEPIKISRLAVSVFEEEGQISISGQGMLRKMFLSAHLSEDKSQLEPPREHYYFNRNSHTGIDTRLVRKVSTYFIITDEEAESQVHLWEVEFMKKVRISNQRFGRFGTFYFDDQLDFISEPLFLYEWLPVLPYKSTGAYPTEHKITENVPPISTHNGRARRKRRILFPALWSVFAFLFVFALFFWSEPLNLLIDKNAELSTRLVNVAPESYSRNETPEYFSDTHEVESTHENGEEIAMTTPDLNETLPNDPSTTIEKNNKLSLLEEKEKTIPTESTVEYIHRCTLIVGAFENPDNVDRMISKLGDYNVEVVTMERNTLTLVGARIKCMDTPQINLLKNQIEPSAWIYKQ